MYGNTEPKGLKAIYDDLHLHRSTVQTNWSLFLNSYIFHNFQVQVVTGKSVEQNSKRSS